MRRVVRGAGASGSQSKCFDTFGRGVLTKGSLSRNLMLELILTQNSCNLLLTNQLWNGSVCSARFMVGGASIFAP